MKPLAFELPKIKAPPVEEAIRNALSNEPGGVGELGLDPRLFDADSFFGTLLGLGYHRRKFCDYSSLALTYVNGACCPHADPGAGIVACWLVHNGNSLGKDGRLITAHGSCNMRENVLCVFDGDETHEWIGDGVCVFLVAAVEPFKRDSIGA